MPFGRRSLDAPRASGLTLPPLNRATGANIWDFHHPEDCEEEEDQATHREGATDPVTPTSDPLPSRVLLYGGVCVLKCRSTSIPEVTAPAKGRPLPVSWEEEDGVTPSTVGLPRLQSLSLRPPHIARNGRFFELASFGPAPLLSPRTPPNVTHRPPSPHVPPPVPVPSQPMSHPSLGAAGTSRSLLVILRCRLFPSLYCLSFSPALTMPWLCVYVCPREFPQHQFALTPISTPLSQWCTLLTERPRPLLSFP